MRDKEGVFIEGENELVDSLGHVLYPFSAILLDFLHQELVEGPFVVGRSLEELVQELVAQGFQALQGVSQVDVVGVFFVGGHQRLDPATVPQPAFRLSEPQLIELSEVALELVLLEARDDPTEGGGVAGIGEDYGRAARDVECALVRGEGLDPAPGCL